MIRNSVVFPEPLSPRIVRNSPSAMSSEMSRSTTLLPNALATLRMLSSGAFTAGCAFVAATFERALRDAIDRSLLQAVKAFRASLRASELLRRLHVVPDLVILRAPRHILPEVNPLLVAINVVEMESLYLVRRHELSGLRIRRHVMRLIGNQLLGLGLDHVFQKFVRQFFVFTSSSDHQVIDPARRVFFRDSLSHRKSSFLQVCCVQRPTHRDDDFVALK